MILDFVEDELDTCTAVLEDEERQPRYHLARLRVLPIADTFILYHGTSSLFFDEIITTGLKSRNETGNSTYEGKSFPIGGETMESNSDKVYMGNFMRAQRLGRYA